VSGDGVICEPYVIRTGCFTDEPAYGFRSLAVRRRRGQAEDDAVGFRATRELPPADDSIRRGHHEVALEPTDSFDLNASLGFGVLQADRGLTTVDTEYTDHSVTA
jgi:hypothetical protein